MAEQFSLPKLNRVHIAWDDALLKPTSKEDQEFSLEGDVNEIFKAVKASGRKKIAFYIHGGLVSSQSEFGQLPFHKNPQNKLLFEALQNKEVYPIYFIWETGVKESIQSAAKDWGEEIGKEPVQFLIKHMAELAQTFLFKSILKYLPKTLANKVKFTGLGLAEPPVLEDVEIEQNLDKLRSYEPAVVDYDDFDEQDQQDFLEKLSNDQEFMNYLCEVGGRNGMGLAPHPDVATLNKNAGGLMELLTDDLQSLPEDAQPSLVEGTGVGLVEVVALQKVGKFLGQLVLAVGNRFVRKEDHGFVATIAEEFFRLVKLNQAGLLIWGQMKANAEKAYLSDKVNGVSHGGYYVIQKLAEYLKANPDTEVSLIGHSAGSIHLSHFMETADVFFDQSESQTLRDFQFSNLIFMAPAVNFETFQKMVNHKKRFSKFHLFTMRESDEMQDSLLGGFSKNQKVDAFLKSVYPCSLLYAVSGLAEDKAKGDMPLLGLARHLDQSVYRGKDSLVLNTQNAIASWSTHINWSHNMAVQGISNAVIKKQVHAGRFGAALHHGDFDNEPWTVESIAALL